MKQAFMKGIVAGSLMFLSWAFPGTAADLPGIIDLGTASQTDMLKINGGYSQEYAGISVASGDVDGDGVADVVYGSVHAAPKDRSMAGMVTVVFGSKDRRGMPPIDSAAKPPRVLQIWGDAMNSGLGQSLAIGDLNHDGIQDIIMGSPEERSGAGTVFILFGSAGLASSGVADLVKARDDVLRVNGRAGGGLGISVASGDINGDGIDDAILGAWRDSAPNRENAGSAYVVFGSGDLKTKGSFDLQSQPEGVLVISGAARGDNLGFGTAAGDVNGDGFDDILLGAWMADTPDKVNAGMVYAIFGNGNTDSIAGIDLAVANKNVVRIRGNNDDDYTGGVIAVGDVTGDGFDDIVIDAFGADTPGGYNAGKTWVVFGSAGMESAGDISLGNTEPRLLAILGEAWEDHLGKPSVGDINGDGVGDIITQSNSADVNGMNDAGKAYVVFGSVALPDLRTVDLGKVSSGVVKILGEESGDNLGMRSAAGDIDADGFDDIIVGAHGASPLARYDAGKVYVVWGGKYSSGIIQQGHFLFSRTAPDSATVLIRKESVPTVLGSPIMPGDEVGIFTLSGICAGAGVWTGSDLNITVYGDDPLSYYITGFRSGDPLFFRVWIKDTNREYTVTPRYASSPNTYQPGAAIEVTALNYNHFVIQSTSGDTATVLIRSGAIPIVYGSPITPGDEIGVFTPSGVCAGTGSWTGSDLNITIYGDDPLSYYTTGFRNGDPLAFRIWLNKTGREYQAAPIFATTAAAFWPDEIIELASLSVSDIIDSVQEQTPGAFALSPNYPNPFNPSTTISFTVPRAGKVNIAVFNALGAKVATLADGSFSGGTHRLVWNAEGMASGAYFCRMRAGDYTETRRMLFVK